MLVAETTVNDAAAVPPKLTAVAPVKFVPAIVTVAPCAAVVGVNETSEGAGIVIGAGSSFLQDINPAKTRIAIQSIILFFIKMIFNNVILWLLK
jgi:hypothetical protein